MKRIDLLQKIEQAGVVAVIRADTEEESVALSSAVIEGGVTGIELTFTVPHADVAITKLTEKYANNPAVVIGAGTVLDAVTARIAIINGAQFIVSPSFNPEVAKVCNLYSIPYTPGCYTPVEIQKALESGVDLVKLFPGNVASPAMVKAVKAPFPNVSIMPTGGVSVENMADWFAAGVTLVGAGSNLTADAKPGDLSGVTAKAREYRAEFDRIRNARS